MNKTLKKFLDVIKIDSPSGHEQRMITFIKNWLNKIGLNYQIDKTGNILAKNTSTCQPILFCVHMDTVEPGKGIKPIIEDEIIKSSGNTILGADNKAALSCLMTAVENYLATEKKPRSFELLFTVKEEIGGGIELFPYKWIKSKKGFTFDSANSLGGIILQSPEICNFYAEFKGKACHSSEPNRGINAFTPTIKALNKIKTGELDNGQTTVNIGIINGGEGINIVADNIVIKGEIRSYNKKLFINNLKKIQNIFIDQKNKTNAKLKFWTDGYCPGYEHKKNSIYIKKIIKIFSDLNMKPKYYLKSGVSDANILNQVGIKTVNLTDGVKNPHTTQELIKIKDLNKLTEIIQTFLLSY